MKIGFIGMGNMAKALCSGFISSGAVSASDISAYAPHRDRLEESAKRLGFTARASLNDLADASDMLFVCCKPYQIEAVLTELSDKLIDKALVSVAAGWTLEKYIKFFSDLDITREEADDSGEFIDTLTDSVRVQVVMPNTPAMVKEGVFLMEAVGTLTEEEEDFLLKVLSPLGLIQELPGHLLGIGSAVTGCSPAFVDIFIEAYADAAVKYGIPRQDAYRLVSQAVLGAAKLQLESGAHPGILKDQVCSPAGTTIRGVQALEAAGLRAACMSSVDAVMGRG